MRMMRSVLMLMMLACCGGPGTGRFLLILMMRSVWGSPVLMLMTLACSGGLGQQAPW